MFQSDGLSYWFAMHVRSRHEKVVSASLRSKGFEEYLPLHRTKGRYREADIPLFPGYLFCRFNIADQLKILQTRGVVSVLSFGNGPVPISETQIGDIRRLEFSGLPIEPWAYPGVGQTIEIHKGPLVGLRGFLCQVRSRQRLVVTVELLKRAVAVEIEQDQIRPATGSYHQSPAVVFTGHGLR